MSSITPSVQCKHFSISCTASSDNPEYLPIPCTICVHVCMCVFVLCVYVTIEITPKDLKMLEYRKM